MGECSARPDKLAAFEPLSASLDADILRAKSMLAEAHGSFRANNRWGDFDASGLLDAIEGFASANRADAAWVAGVGEAFRAADASGDVAHAPSINVGVSVKPTEHVGGRGLGNGRSEYAVRLARIYGENRQKALEFAERAELETYHLDLHIKDLERRYDNGLQSPDPWPLDVAIPNRQLQMREAVARAETFRALADPDRNLLQITDDPVPRVSEVHGDLAAADGVTFLFPGTGTTAANFNTKREDAKFLLRMQDEEDKGRVHAVIDSLSYEAPSAPVALPDMLGDFASDGFLERSGDDIAAFVDSAPLPAGATVSAVGHSYGSTALGQATLEHELKWDNLVGAGSPGMVAEQASDLEAGDVFMVAQAGDPVTGVGGTRVGNVLRADVGPWGAPYAAGFGARQLGKYDPGVKFSAHSRYFSRKYGRLREIARATTDRI